MTSGTIKAVILGGTGYVSGELLRLLASHPHFALSAAVSESRCGDAIASVFPHLQAAYPKERFCSLESWADDIEDSADVAIFSAAPHGASAALVRHVLNAASGRKMNVHVVDSSADFRYPTAAEFEAVYGGAHQAPELLPDFFCAVPEHCRDARAAHAGHPGCFATAILLAAVPLITAEFVQGQVYVSATTGSTGSGRSPQAGTHHPERHSNMYAYKPLAHRHVPEVENLIRDAGGSKTAVNFVPHSGAFARGIYASLQAALAKKVSPDEIRARFREYYSDAEFVRVVDGMPKLKDVVASNYAHIGIDASDDTVVVTCAIDNLVKGAAGGAIQWMNRLWSVPEISGLTAPAPAWT